MEQWNDRYVEYAKTHQSTIHKKETPVVQPKVSVYTGIREIDEILGGLHTGNITAFIGKSKLLSTLLHRVCVNTVDMFHSPSIVLDAENQINPFLLARLARLQITSDEDVLQNVYLSRAYTIYQLTDLIHSHVESLIQKKRPVTLILTGVCSLLADANLSKDEANHLFTHMMKKIKQMTEQYQIATVIIDTHTIDLDRASVEVFIDTLIQIKEMRHCPRITITQKNQQVTVTSETVGQLCLQDFGMVI
ncbi:MAG: hypothetical protein KGY65_03750 [Candidatus Thermoplasmatota archaeon]|nr:hypothetical protein [Candidatus Thermoplasmatota archaeon]MBS3801844.1 hypothetical protein [Candidatus Thermoplasmatota archaeon]